MICAGHFVSTPRVVVICTGHVVSIPRVVVNNIYLFVWNPLDFHKLVVVGRHLCGDAILKQSAATIKYFKSVDTKKHLNRNDLSA